MLTLSYLQVTSYLSGVKNHASFTPTGKIIGLEDPGFAPVGEVEAKHVVPSE